MTRLIFPTRQQSMSKRLEPISRQHKFDRETLQQDLEIEPKHIDGLRASSPGDKNWGFDGRFFSHVVGIDRPPHGRAMSKREVSELGDHFTQNLILEGVFPLTLRVLLDEIASLNDEKALPLRRMFLVAEGAQHQASDPNFPLNARLVFSWQKSQSDMAEILLSTVPALDDETTLLQLIAWSKKDTSFHLFERSGTSWTWAGNGHHAFDPRSRGIGPFDSHINGGLVMKELKAPWAHWNSMNNSISPSLLEGTDYGRHPAMMKIDNAEDLEPIIIKANRTWTRARLARDEQAGEIANPINYLRQVLTSTSVNLVSSADEFDMALKGSISLPRSFFLDVDAITKLSRRAGISNPIPTSQIKVDGASYVKAIQKLDIGVQMSANDPRVLGDTHFCFLVPERAFEDLAVVLALQKSKLISAKMLLCLHLVDFANPVDSPIRQTLLNSIPNFPVPFAEGSIEEVMLASIRQSATTGRQADVEFLSYWEADDLGALVKKQLEEFFENLLELAKTPEGVLDIVRLGEARRNQFRRRDLHEFGATVARSTVDIPNLGMRKDATIFINDTFV